MNYDHALEPEAGSTERPQELATCTIDGGGRARYEDYKNPQASWHQHRFLEPCAPGVSSGRQNSS